MNVLQTMHISLPNAAHMLLAIHIARGGFQVSLNLDQGVEIAYELLTGRRRLPRSAPTEAERMLAGWRQLLPEKPAALRVVATVDEFAAWAENGRAPALLKIHGSICQRNGRTLGIDFADPIVEDDPELQQLSPDRLAALDKLTDHDEVLITGYSGRDIDVYFPLLDRLRPGSFTWAVPVLPEGKEDVARHVEELGGQFVRGWGSSPSGSSQVASSLEHDGRATTNLAEILELSVPRWLDQPIQPHWHQSFAVWRKDVLRESEILAVAYPWMLFDVLRYDFAVQALEAVRAQNSDRAWNVKVRLADALYHRNHGSDRADSRRLFREIARSRQAPRSLRLYSSVRLGEVFRSGSNLPKPAAVLVAWVAPNLVVAHAALARRVMRRETPDQAALGLAHSTIGHLQLRLTEQAMAAGIQRRRFGRRLLQLLCHRSLMHQERAIAMSGGNRGSFARQQVSEAKALGHLLAGTQPSDDDELRTLDRIRNSYLHMPDPRGAANAQAGLALWHAVSGEMEQAHRDLDAAFEGYKRPGSTNDFDRSGVQLVERRRAIVMWTEAQEFHT